MRWIQYTDVAISICSNSLVLPMVLNPVRRYIQGGLRMLATLWTNYICHDCTFTLRHLCGKLNVSNSSRVDFRSGRWCDDDYHPTSCEQIDFFFKFAYRMFT